MNLLLLQADQHHAGLMSWAGSDQVATPRLDRLAAEGCACPSAWCQDGICLPSRSSMLSGRHPRSLGCAGNRDPGPLLGVATLQGLLRAAGWRTAAFGKRHLAPALDGGWDETATTMPEPFDPSQDSYWDWIRREGLAEAWQADWDAEHGTRLGRRSAPLMAAVSRLDAAHTMEAWTAARTVDFLRRRAADRQPFACWCSFYRPHQPYTPLAADLARHPPERLRLPPSATQDPAHLPPLLREWRRGPEMAEERHLRFAVACYHALIEAVDRQVGTVLDALDGLGLGGDTLVLYLSDHGDFAGEHGLIEKCAAGHNCYQATLRVPFIVRWPGRIPPGGRCPGLVELTDVLPTVLAAAGLEPPAGLAGRDLLPALARGALTGRTTAFSANAVQAAAIGGRCTLARTLDGGQDLLFDRQRDPWELEDRAADPLLADERLRLAADLDAWLAATPWSTP